LDGLKIRGESTHRSLEKGRKTTGKRVGIEVRKNPKGKTRKSPSMDRMGACERQTSKKNSKRRIGTGGKKNEENWTVATAAASAMGKEEKGGEEGFAKSPKKKNVLKPGDTVTPRCYTEKKERRKRQ